MFKLIIVLVALLAVCRAAKVFEEDRNTMAITKDLLEDIEVSVEGVQPCQITPHPTPACVDLLVLFFPNE